MPFGFFYDGTQLGPHFIGKGFHLVVLQDALGLIQGSAVQIGGTILFGMTIIGAVWSLARPDDVDWRLPAVTGGLSLSQLAAVFFGQPMARLQKNLTNLANFRMILESHSLKMALARFHLTTAETLRGNLAESEETAKAAETQVKSLNNQIKAIERIEEADYKALSQLGLGGRETMQAVLGEEEQPEKK